MATLRLKSRIQEPSDRESLPISSTRKKVIVLLPGSSPIKAYLNPSILGQSLEVDLLTPEGEHLPLRLAEIKCIYFVREFGEPFEPERKNYLTRPKLDGLWVRLRFQDGEAIEGIVANDLLDIRDAGLQVTPPDLHGNTLRMFVPRAALAEVKVLGVIGAARRTSRDKRRTPPDLAGIQSKLFDE